MDTDKIAEYIRSGKIGILLTDTIYGLVGSALNSSVVERIYAVKGRSPDKPFIILIASLNDLQKFGIEISHQQEEFLNKVWPNPISVVLPCPGEKLKYLHRGTFSLAFRIPGSPVLQELIKNSGPIIAPSANPEGVIPAKNIDQARDYFGDKVDFYVDGGEMKSPASTLVRVDKNGFVEVLRQGSFKLPA